MVAHKDAGTILFRARAYLAGVVDTIDVPDFVLLVQIQSTSLVLLVDEPRQRGEHVRKMEKVDTDRGCALAREREIDRELGGRDRDRNSDRQIFYIQREGGRDPHKARDEQKRPATPRMHHKGSRTVCIPVGRF